MKTFGLFLLLLTLTYHGEVVEAQGREARIVNGIDAFPGEFPYTVGVYGTYKTSSDKRMYTTCSGSIYNPNYVISAAHCVSAAHRVNKSLTLDVIKIVAGEHWTPKKSLPEQVRKHKKIIMHEKYNFTTYQNDIALIKVDKPFKCTLFVQPISLSKTIRDDKLASDLEKNCVTAGWGRLSTTEKKSNVLKKAKMYLHSDPECRSYSNYSTNFSKNICARSIYSVTCSGDSGGPLVCNDELVGIASYNIEMNENETSCKINNPVGFTEVAHYVTWIEKNVVPTVTFL